MIGARGAGRGNGFMPDAGFLDRSRIVAPANWSRWLVPPAALSIHLAIGQAYAWSVFKDPLSATLLKGSSWAGTLSALPFTLGIVMLGVSAAIFGTAVDHRGPRWAMVVATACSSAVSGWASGTSRRCPP